MNNRPLISVIIPCYNVGNYIQECVRSVQKQTYPMIEIICVNDGSTDHTLDELDKLREENENKITLVKQKNKGQSAALNAGIKIAKGSYLQFLDGDDLLYETKLEHQVLTFLQNDNTPDIIASAVEKRFENGRVKIDKNMFYPPWEALARFHIGITSSNLWKRSAVLKVGGFDEALPSNKEHDLILRMLKNGANVNHDSSPLTIKRERSKGSISSQFDHLHLKRKIIHRAKIHEYTRRNLLLEKKVLDYLIEKNIQDLKKIRKIDESMAYELHSEYIPDNYILKSNFSTSYKWMYNLIGFKNAEILRSYLGK